MMHYVQLTQLKDEVHGLIVIPGNVEIKNIYWERNVLDDEDGKYGLESIHPDINFG